MFGDDEEIRSDRDLAADYKRGMESQDRIIADYQRDNEALLAERDALRDRLKTAAEAVEKIVIDEGTDAGVILLSWESPYHYDADAKCQVYDHENFSPLGDAMVALSHVLRGEPDKRRAT